MGRIKTKDIKAGGEDLLSVDNKFSADFEATKTELNSFGFNMSKRVRNKMAGYITRKKKIQSRK